jgi:hypothetical protein
MVGIVLDEQVDWEEVAELVTGPPFPVGQAGQQFEMVIDFRRSAT